jgi:hypothetical protein
MQAGSLAESLAKAIDGGVAGWMPAFGPKSAISSPFR